jgi:hypothetical protein
MAVSTDGLIILTVSAVPYPLQDPAAVITPDIGGVLPRATSQQREDGRAIKSGASTSVVAPTVTHKICVDRADSAVLWATMLALASC